MIVLDENIVDSQVQLLRSWRIKIKQIGDQIGRLGMKDSAILPLLRRVGGVTFFTRDRGFFDRRLRHLKYCVVWLDVGQYETASFVRRFLKHAQFKTKRSRLGSAVRVSHVGISVWWWKRSELERIVWPIRSN